MHLVRAKEINAGRIKRSLHVEFFRLDRTKLGRTTVIAIAAFLLCNALRA
jgi:hypothetical protein